MKVYGDDEYSVDWEFGVKYDDFPEEYEVDLMEDWEKDWVVICKGGQETKEKGKEVVEKSVEGRGEIVVEDSQVSDIEETRRPKRKKRKLNKKTCNSKAWSHDKQTFSAVYHVSHVIKLR